MIQSYLKNKILHKSISLEKFGIKNFAWEKEEAIQLINTIINDEIGILGGDVYSVNSNKLIPRYENWFCDRRKQEDRKEFYVRSKISALEYISNYPVHKDEKILFAMIFTEILD